MLGLLCCVVALVLFLSRQTVVVHVKVFQVYEVCETELPIVVRYHQHDGYKLFCPSAIQGSALTSGS